MRGDEDDAGDPRRSSLVAVAWRPLRAAPRRAGWWPTLGVAVVVGGIWSVRDLVDHGSPLWPLVSAPWGDPVPATFRALGARFLDHPRHLIGAYWRDVPDRPGGRAVLIGSGIALPLVRRSRAALGSAGAAALALLAWGVAPYTGLENYGAVGAIANTRYLLPAIAACAVALDPVGAGGRAGPAAGGAWRPGRVDRLLGRQDGGLRAAAPVAGHAGRGGGGRRGRRRRGPPVADRPSTAGWSSGAVGLAGRARAWRRVGATGTSSATWRPTTRPITALYALAGGDAGRGGPIASFPGRLRAAARGPPGAPAGADRGRRALRGGAGAAARGPVVLGVAPASAAERRLAGCLRGAASMAVGGYAEVYP